MGTLIVIILFTDLLQGEFFVSVYTPPNLSYNTKHQQNNIMFYLHIAAPIQ